MYKEVKKSDPLMQGDIIDNCPVYIVDPDDPALDSEPKLFELRVIVITQACDLAQDKCNRVVVATVWEAQDLVADGVLKAKTIRDQIRLGKSYGVYFLPAINDRVEFPESIVDLRDLNTIPRKILDLLIAEDKRVCSLETPWREHLAQHFGVTYMRIGLPEPYQTQP